MTGWGYELWSVCLVSLQYFNDQVFTVGYSFLKRQILSCFITYSMAAQTATSLGVLYGELNKYCQNSDYERAVKSANKGE